MSNKEDWLAKLRRDELKERTYDDFVRRNGLEQIIDDEARDRKMFPHELRLMHAVLAMNNSARALHEDSRSLLPRNLKAPRNKMPEEIYGHGAKLFENENEL